MRNAKFDFVCRLSSRVIIMSWNSCSINKLFSFTGPWKKTSPTLHVLRRVLPGFETAYHDDAQETP